MSDPLRLVTGPTASELVRADLVQLLERTLEEARRGEITELFMILRHPGDDEWSDRSTPTQGFAGWIGRLEITKQSWITLFSERERLR